MNFPGSENGPRSTAINFLIKFMLPSSQSNLLPTPTDLQRYMDTYYGDISKHGWRVRLRHRFGYLAGEDYYEAASRWAGDRNHVLDRCGRGKEPICAESSLEQDIS